MILLVGGNGFLTFLTFQSSGSGALGGPFPPPREPPGDPGGQEIAKIAKIAIFVKIMEISWKIADFLIFSAKRSIFRLFSENGASRHPGVEMYCIRKHFELLLKGTCVPKS